MKLSLKNYCAIGGLAAWGAVIGTSVNKLCSQQMLKRAEIERVVSEQKIDSLKNVIKEEMPATAAYALKTLQRKFSGHQLQQQVIDWEKALDSMRVNKAGQEVINEYNSKIATEIYKAGK